MNVEYTARKYEITPTIRKEVETGLNKIRKILGDRFESKVILAVEKRQHKAEITINPPNGPIVGLAQTTDMMSAVNEALDHLQKQALKHKTKWLSKKRKAVKKFDGQSLEDNIEAPLGLVENATVSVLVHKFPSVARTTEVHLVHAKDSVALRPMTLEEAIKEAHFRDRDVFVFRDPKGTLMVLHRTRDGKMELIEVP
ncbi:MAG TPA: ribosome-associated translation inhibitor RaiA [Terriglobales bacterium]|jgi:putative sigma-54 modulation protein|nr:ribosome-associated translation inhibitor RaiA [Terriglobales bacterium]